MEITTSSQSLSCTKLPKTLLSYYSNSFCPNSTATSFSPKSVQVLGFNHLPRKLQYRISWKQLRKFGAVHSSAADASSTSVVEKWVLDPIGKSQSFISCSLYFLGWVIVIFYELFTESSQFTDSTNKNPNGCPAEITDSCLNWLYFIEIERNYLSGDGDTRHIGFKTGMPNAFEIASVSSMIWFPYFFPLCLLYKAYYYYYIMMKSIELFQVAY